MRVCLILGGLSLVLSTIQWVVPINNPDEEFAIRGNYDPELSSIDSIEEFSEFVSNTAEDKRVSPLDTGRFTQLVDSIVSQRFYHGTAWKTYRENYLNYIIGKLFWSDLLMESSANHILEHQVAVCNQINLVFQKLIEPYGYRFRTVGLSHHQFTEVFYNGNWHIHDPDYEPKFGTPEPPSTEKLLESDSLMQAAFGHIEKENFNPHYEDFMASDEPVVLEEGQIGAQNLKLFHSITFYYSQFGWSIWFLIAGGMFYFRRRKGK